MADMGVTETSATAVDVISAMVQKQLIAESVISATILDETARVAPGAKSVAFPKTGDLDPAVKAENTGTTAQVLTLDKDTLLLDKHYHTLVVLEDNADVQSVVNIQEEIVNRAFKGMSKQIDTAIYNVLKAGASTSNPDHTLAGFAANATLSLTMILEARKLLNIQNVPMGDRYLLISPYQEAEMLAISDFISAEKYGSNDILLNGQIGRVYGFKVLMTTVCEDNVAIWYHNTAAAWARQIAPKWEKDRDLDKLADKYSLSYSYGVKALDGGKRQVTNLVS